LEILVSNQKQFSSIALESGVFETQITKKFAQRKLYERQAPGVIKAVIPGVISEILTRTGNTVRQGDTLLILEAMKMLNRLIAPLDGTVKAIHVKAGARVVKGQVLAEIKPAARPR
jgi:biotin carboxyl carrier protein